MVKRTQIVFALCIVCVAGWAARASAEAPVGAMITYQGKLVQSGNAVSGSADIQCTLWDEAAGGAQIGSQAAIDNLNVVDGVFTANLDFGPGAFNGNERWIEIAVRVPHDPGDTQPFITLSPRQPLRAAPYAVYALNSAPAALPTGGAWDLTSTLNVENNTLVIEHDQQRIGIHHTEPVHTLHVNGDIYAASYLGIDGTTAFVPGGVSISSPQEDWMAFNAGGAQRMVLTSNGSLGIGRTPTSNRLEVNGNASKASGGTWLTNSDARIKTNVHDVEDAIEVLKQIRLVNFRYSPEYLAAHPVIEDDIYYNVIAQEFAQVFPDSVASSGERLPGYVGASPHDKRPGVYADRSESADEILQVDIHPLIIYSAAAIQELNKKHDADVEQLRSKISTVEGENQSLRNRLQQLEQTVQRLESRVSRID